MDGIINASGEAKSTQMQMMINRQAQEVQAAMVVAQKFPRDQLMACQRIKNTCQRMSLAKQAIYTYPRGGQTVEGPSIRLAEAIAQNWGNIDYGVIELDSKDGSSEMMAYAWDLETNTRSTKIFHVEHVRESKKGGKQKLTDSRDIYEATANFGARRMRACILAIIPGDVVEEAVDECKKTVSSGQKNYTPAELAKKIINVFKEYKVTKEMLEKYIGMNMGEIGTDQANELYGIYQAVKDGQAKPEDYFEFEKVVDALGTDK